MASRLIAGDEPSAFEPQILERIVWSITNEGVRRGDLKIVIRAAHRPKRMFMANQNRVLT
jgi:hypothetical protein